MLTSAKFKKEDAEWFIENDDIEFFVSDEDGKPSEAQIGLANRVIEQLEYTKERVKAILEDFMKDKGEFFYNAIHFGSLASKYECDFVFEVGFEAEENRHEYMYAGMQVCFTLNLNAPKNLQNPHPYKFIVEYS
jgi:hypothetical protein